MYLALDRQRLNEVGSGGKAGPGTAFAPGQAVSPEEAWQLAHYVASLQEPAHWNMIAHPLLVDGALPETLDDPRWALAEPTDVRLRNVVSATGQWDQPPTVKAVSFRAITNGEAIAWLVSWHDPTLDVDDSADGLAVLVKPEGGQGDVVSLQAWPYAGSPPLDLVYWSARRDDAIETLAMDFDSLLTPSPRGSARQAAAAYEDGRWQLVVHRPLHPSDLDDAATISPERFTSMAFAVWDGGNPTARAVSPWVELALPHRTAHEPVS
jgi:DMSO reductase family type II enzyme heme b subunit